MRLIRIGATALVILLHASTSSPRIEAWQCGTTCISGKQFDMTSEVFRACNKTPIGSRWVSAFGPITKHWATKEDLSA
jgi:hypothetical protein